MRKFIFVLTMGLIGVLAMGIALALTINIVESAGGGNITVTSDGTLSSPSVTFTSPEVAATAALTGGTPVLGSQTSFQRVDILDPGGSGLSDQLLIARTPFIPGVSFLGIPATPASVRFLFRSDIDPSGGLAPIPPGVPAVFQSLTEAILALPLFGTVTEPLNGGSFVAYNSNNLIINVQSDPIKTPEASATILLGISLFGLATLGRKKLLARS